MKRLLSVAIVIMLVSSCKQNCNEYSFTLVNHGSVNWVSINGETIVVAAHSDTTVIYSSKPDSVFYFGITLSNPPGYKVGNDCAQTFDVTKK
jgi:hypothetical protein